MMSPSPAVVKGSEQSSSSPRRRSRRRRARHGDVVTLRLLLEPENGFVPEPLFDGSGDVSFVLGWGNYLPGLHELVEGCAAGDCVQDVSIDAGWGGRQDDLVVHVPKAKLSDYEWKVGETFRLKGMQVLVAEDLGDTVVLDANPPLAGTSYRCNFTVLAIEDVPPVCGSDSDNGATSSSPPPRYQVASFALGCFWGAELAFLRQPGVVGTRVGYSHGTTPSPTYDEVCEGRTQHRETVLVVYDPNVVSYVQLLRLALERLAVTSAAPSETAAAMGLSRLFGEEDADGVPSSAGGAAASSSKQYQHGFYYHTEEQRLLTEQEIRRTRNRFGVELRRADVFYDAEEYHQKYLYKGGQSARKGCRDTIRCYG